MKYTIKLDGLPMLKVKEILSLTTSIPDFSKSFQIRMGDREVVFIEKSLFKTEIDLETILTKRGIKFSREVNK